MKFPELARVRWRPLQWIVPYLLVVLLANEVHYTSGAPQAQFRFSGPQRQQNPSVSHAGPFRVVPDFDDIDDDDIVFTNARHRGSNINGASLSGGVPLSATRSGVRQDAARSHFSAPTHSGRRGVAQQSSTASFGVPLSSSRSEFTQTSGASFGVPLSATRSTGQEIPPTVRKHFGVPLSATRSEGNQQTFQAGNAHFGVPLSASRPAIRQETSHFSPPTHKTSKVNPGTFFFREDDNFSLENVDNSLEIMSLGRRFHPEGIPRRSEVTLSNVPPAPSRTVISNPFIFTPEMASISRDLSLEDDDDDTFIVLSPMVKAYNPSAHNERLSLSNDFLNQYNYVDVQGTTHWGYKTDDQYQEHQVHDSGTMQGKFGWTSPEGSQVNIKYVADEGGYRVLSSSGIYTKEDDEVLRLKKLHLAEHEKARINHQNIKEERRKNNVGIPLPTQFGNAAPADPSTGSGGFVIIPDDDDFPLIPGRGSGMISGTDAGVGVALPTLGSTDFQPELDVFIDSSSSAGVPLSPITNQEGFGVPLSTSTNDQAVIPLSDPNFNNELADPTISSGDRGFGVPLPEPTMTFEPGMPSISSSGQEFGVPLSDSSSGQEFGVPLADSSITPGFGQSEFGQSFAGDQAGGVPLPGPTVMFGSGQTSGSSADQGTGVPLSDPTFASGQPSVSSVSQGVGVPLPDPTTTFESGQPSVSMVDQGAGVSLPDPIFTRVPLTDSTFHSGFDESSFPLAEQGGVPLSDFSLNIHPEKPMTSSASQGNGVPLSEIMTTFASRDPSTTFSGQSVGVSLFDTRTDIPSEMPSNQGAGVSLPGDQGSGVLLPDSTPTFGFGESSISPANEGFGVSLSDQTVFEHSITSSTDQGSGVPLSHSAQTVPSSFPRDQGSVDSHLMTSFGAEAGVPLPPLTETGAVKPSSSVAPGQDLKVTFIDSQGALEPTAPHSVSEQEIGVPLFGTSAISDSSLTTAVQPTETLSPGQDFGIPLGDPFDIFGIMPVGPSNQVPTSAGAESVPSGNEKLGSSRTTSTQPETFGVSLFPTDATFSTGDVGVPVGAVGENEITNFGVSLNQGSSHITSSVSSTGDSSLGEPISKTPSPTLIDRTNEQHQPASQPGHQVPFGVPLDFNPLTTQDDIRPGQAGGNFFLFPEDDFFGLPQGAGVGLGGGGAANTLQPVDVSTSQVGHTFTDQPNVGVPLSPIFAGGDPLQGPPVETVNPSFTRDNTQTPLDILDPCLNSKIHPALLPPECATRKTEHIQEPSQNIGKSLLPSTGSKKTEPAQDSFIVVVNSDIFH